MNLERIETPNSFKLSQETIYRLNEVFTSAEEYRTIVNDLRKTRKGLWHIVQERPELKSQIMSQLESINKVTSALIIGNEHLIHS
ncbi:MAG: hypothetical protein CMP59_00630 [Flavobacteriales bacterium]|nr:hypothetical protein [Flavobacteriales bacterium]